MTSELDLEQLEKVARLATGAAEPSDWQADVSLVVKSLAAFEGQTSGSVDRLIECDGVYGTMDGRVATHIAAFDPPTVLALIARLREAEAKVERVREQVRAEVQRARPRPGESSPDAIRRSVSRAITGRITQALGEES